MKNLGIDPLLVKRIFNSNLVSIPRRLLVDASKLNMTMEEGYLVLVLWTLVLEQEQGVTESDLSKKIGIGEDKVLEILGGLIAKGILTYEKKEGDFSYCLKPLYEALFLEEANGAQEPEDGPSSLYQKFEGEFKRPLSPIEIDFLVEWQNEKDYSVDMITEALKVSVGVGKLNFKYIDHILLDWQKKGVVTARENEAAEEAKGQKVRKKTTFEKKKGNSEKYKGIYLN